jgi:hypothetical protein
LSRNSIADSRTYAELQPVRSSGDANQVLRQHQEQSEVIVAPRPAAAESDKDIPANDQQQNSDNKVEPAVKERAIIKQEPMTPMQVHNLTNEPGSVNVLSVRPAPASVSIISNHMAKQMQGKNGMIGQGDKLVCFNYSNCSFGPIHVSSDAEVRAIVALTQCKIEEREYRYELICSKRSRNISFCPHATSPRNISFYPHATSPRKISFCPHATSRDAITFLKIIPL